MDEYLIDSRQAEAIHAGAVAKEAEQRLFEGMQDKLVASLQHALTYEGNDRPALVARIPVICNDIKWIKRAVIGIFVLMGTLLVALLAK